MKTEFPELDKWIDDWKQTREDDRKDAKQFPLYKKYVKEDTQIIQRLVRERKRLEKKHKK